MIATTPRPTNLLSDAERAELLPACYRGEHDRCPGEAPHREYGTFFCACPRCAGDARHG